MTDSAWLVVVFEDDNSVAAIPKKWLIEESDGQCKSYWPPRAKNASISAKKRETPQQNWQKYDITILGTYDNYELALKRTVRAENKNNLSSAPEDNCGKRIIKKNKKFYDSHSSENSTSSDEATCKINKTKSTIGNMPALKQSLLKSYKNRSDDMDESIRNDDASESVIRNETNLRKNTLEMALGTPKRTMETTMMNTPLSSQATLMATPQNSSFNDTGFQRQILTKLNLILAQLKLLTERVDEIETAGKVSNNVDDKEVENDLVSQLGEIFPIESEEKLRTAEIFLEANRKFLVKELSRIGGNNVKDITKKIMYKVITNNFGEFYSWEGGKGKKKFRELKISAIIFDAVRQNKRTAEACDDEIINGIKMWLVKAKDRRINDEKRVSKGINLTVASAVGLEH